MQRKPELIDDLSDDGDLAMWAEMSSPAVTIIMAELRRMTLTECNDWCRRLAAQLLDELGPHFTDWERLLQLDHRLGRPPAAQRSADPNPARGGSQRGRSCPCCGAPQPPNDRDAGEHVAGVMTDNGPG